jgi:hypothetical protein
MSSTLRTAATFCETEEKRKRVKGLVPAREVGQMGKIWGEELTPGAAVAWHTMFLRSIFAFLTSRGKLLRRTWLAFIFFANPPTGVGLKACALLMLAYAAHWAIIA